MLFILFTFSPREFTFCAPEYPANTTLYNIKFTKKPQPDFIS